MVRKKKKIVPGGNIPMKTGVYENQWIIEWLNHQSIPPIQVFRYLIEKEINEHGGIIDLGSCISPNRTWHNIDFENDEVLFLDGPEALINKATSSNKANSYKVESYSNHYDTDTEVENENNEINAVEKDNIENELEERQEEIQETKKIIREENREIPSNHSEKEEKIQPEKHEEKEQPKEEKEESSPLFEDIDELISAYKT